MAIEFADSCGDIYTMAQAPRFWTAYNSNASIQPGFTNNCLRATVNTWLQNLTPRATYLVMFRFKMEQTAQGGSSNMTLCNVLNGSNRMWSLGLDPTGHLCILKRTDSSGTSTTLATSPTVLSNNTWYHLGFKVTIGAGTAGRIQVWLAGDASAPHLDTGGINTTNYDASTTITAVSFNQNTTGSVGFVYLDDVAVLNTTNNPTLPYPGDCTVTALLPNAAGANTGFTPVPGGNANYQNVNQAVSDDNATYNSAAGVLTDSFAFPDIAAAGGILGVVVKATAELDIAGSATLAPVAVKSGVTATGPATVLGNTYSVATAVFDTNAAGTAWDLATFNATEFGYKRVS